MHHKGTVLLVTDRLVLRRFIIEDSDIMYRNWASEDKVTKFLTWPAHSDAGVSKTVLSNWIDNYNKVDFYNWAIELKEIGEAIGNISVVNINEKTECALLGYCLGTKWWGLGIMPEAAKYGIQY